MNFIALGVIAEVDDIYAKSLSQNGLRKGIEERDALKID